MNAGLYALQILQIVLSYGSALLNMALYIVAIYILLGPGRKLIQTTIAYLNAKKVEETLPLADSSNEVSLDDEEITE